MSVPSPMSEVTLSVSYRLILDGINTIVALEMRGEFAVPTAGAAGFAQDAILRLVARLTGRAEDELRSEMEGQFWMGGGWRPNE